MDQRASTDDDKCKEPNVLTGKLIVRPFRISIIIPAYNASKWIRTTIESVLNQSGVSDWVQVVVVDDGSTDDTASIADAYAHLARGRVKVVRKSNGGVGSALNAGLDASEGEFVGFLGADDRLASDAIAKVLRFFDLNSDAVDLVAIPLVMFGARSGPHWNNKGRYTRTRVIDVSKEWRRVHPHGGGTFVRASAINRMGLRFDERLFIFEDAVFNTSIIVEKLAYGVIHDTVYYNRRHPVGDSLVSSASVRTEYYSQLLSWAHTTLLDRHEDESGVAPLYVQAVVMYDLAWRFRDANLAHFSVSELDAYRSAISLVLKRIDDSVIISSNLTIREKIGVLDLKYGADIISEASFQSGAFVWRERKIYGLKHGRKKRLHHRLPTAHIRKFEVRGDHVQIYGEYRGVVFPGMELGFLVDGVFHEPVFYDQGRHSTLVLGKSVDTGWEFVVTLPYGPGQSLTPVVRVHDGSTFAAEIRLHRFTRFSGSPSIGYFRHDRNEVFRREGLSTIVRERVGTIGSVRREVGFLRRARRNGASSKVFFLRWLALLRRCVQMNPVWLFGDHKLEAGDNSEALFRYVVAEADRLGVKPIFWLDKSSAGFESLQKIGKIVRPDSLSFKLAYLCSRWTLTSAADEFVVNPMGADITFLNDLRPDYQGFLQHGVTKDDQSAWLNRWSKGFDLFVTSSKREQVSIQAPEYGYRKNSIVLTGMPRYDLLRSNSEGILLIAPTWRRSLVGSLDASTGRNAPHPEFCSSGYFRFWQSLIVDPDLNKSLRSSGMKGVFALHPSHSSELSRFVGGSEISILNYPYDYRRLFESSSILITDYSSVAFDFAYLRKPVVYSQADRSEFFDGHLYKPGYFSYDSDGFGPVAHDLQSTVGAVRSLIERGCVLDSRYRERIEDFFEFDDAQNSARVVSSMLEIESEGTDAVLGGSSQMRV